MDIEIELWPENALPMQVFMAMQTQWRIGMGGATGLDYSALPVVEDRLKRPQKTRRAECFKGANYRARGAARLGRGGQSAAKRITGNIRAITGIINERVKGRR
ncbi:DUF1799 domain-containing protein [Dentiradicibacter hellwigii]|uniref:DUF1799 domain-containing protein n=1 Tax=Dentiradicibacter hellwigii TaxID=3149053 RepID=A0ABV4UBW1_9RHOO